MNNVLGISFCIQSIERISIGSYKIGAILLCGLFFYDIFWVFGTDVMVTVAKSLDGPIKLLFPRAFENLNELGEVVPLLNELGEVIRSGKAEFSLLGLGDIVIPGLFVSILLRYDAVRAKINMINAENQSFPKPYFNANVISYALGLVTTVGVMYFFNAAQPALLYLVPACLGGSLLVGAVKGELGKDSPLFAYNEEKVEEEEVKKQEEDKKVK
jgi:minor histocompatibility antigen H13